MKQVGRAGGRMPHALEPQGDAALAAIMRRAPLLGFDFDGTLAPIVPSPDHARLSQSVSRKLAHLAARLPVAIVSGRRAPDVARRLGFEPFRVIGNHGADLAGSSGREALDPVRHVLSRRSRDLAEAGVGVEDKGLSIALHYRLSRQPERATGLIRDILAPMQSECRIFGGKMVENVVPLGVPDKGEAMRQLARECAAECALFVGDDVNDEPVFASAPEGWLGIRIGRHDPNSRADYFLDSSSEIGMLLDRLITHLPAA